MKLSLRGKLLAAFTLNLLLLTFLGLSAGLQLQSMDAKASFVHRHSAPLLHNAEAIQFLIIKYRLLQSEYVFNKSSADRKRIEQDLAEIESEMESLLRTRASSIDSEAARAALKGFEARWQAFVELTYQTYLPVMREEATGSVNPAFGRLAPPYQDLVAAAQLLLRQSRELTLVAVAEAQETYRAARRIMLGVTLVVLAAAAALGFSLSSHITRNLRHLIQATVAVAGGDLERRVHVRSQDELGVLARCFNNMVSALRGQQQLLAQRNAELEHSLSVQQRLTDDLVKRKAAEEEAYRAQAAAEAASRAKSEFLSRMSHELRTPLNAILGFAQLLQMQELSQQQQNSIDSILKSGRHLLDLINEVLDIARIEAGQLSLSLEPVHARAVVAEVLESIEPLAAQRNIKLENQIATEPAEYVLADYQRLKQVLLNLLSNAVKYNREGGLVVLSAQRQPPDQLCIAVADSGPGIAPADLKLLFTPFTRVGHEESSIEGVGLGLALSRRMVEAMGGAIGVESVLGEGSTFWFTLATTEPVEPAPGAAGLPEDRPLYPCGALCGTVLYIEDNLANIRLIEEVVALCADVKLLSALQGRLGLDLARRYSPDLIILDLNLPDLHGGEVLRQLRADPTTRSIPVVVVSAAASRRQIEWLRAAGAQDYLTKPIQVRELLRILQITLEVAARQG